MFFVFNNDSGYNLFVFLFDFLVGVNLKSVGSQAKSGEVGWDFPRLLTQHTLHPGDRPNKRKLIFANRLP